MSKPLPKEVHHLQYQLTIVNKEFDRLDILIENAGVATQAFRITQDEWEETYSVLNCI
jgi:NADP-dependent 3-hydroxy acid dehydrogenase YdfG